MAGVYSSLPQHSPLPVVFDAARDAYDRKADLLVSIGGGSNIDAAKLIQHALSLGCFEMAGVLRSRTKGASVAATVEPRNVQHVSVPTTLSGAEFTYFAGGRNFETGLKEAFTVPALLPRSIIFDQALTVRTPDDLWLSSGIRALDHAIEP